MLPKNFLLGFSLAGFQSEMGISDPDSNSDWWLWVHDPVNIRTGLVSGDLPENGIGYWDLYKKYNGLAVQTGMNAARLGVEWSRIFPKSTEEVKVMEDYKDDDLISVDVNEGSLEKLDRLANQKAINRYMEIFNNIKENNMTLIVNVYHWPIPIYLHDPIEARNSGLSNKRNGWLNHKTVVEFVKYAKYLAWKFSDVADMFSIMNEPNVVFGNGYFNVKSGFPPAFPSVHGGLLAKKHEIEAIARSYDAMKEITKKPVGLIMANSDVQPLTDEDKEAAEMATYNDRYSFIDPLRVGEMKWADEVTAGNPIGEKSNIDRSDLKNKLDWIGVNYYTRAVVKKSGNGYTTLKGYGHSATAGMPSRAGRDVSDFGWEFYPEGLVNVLSSYWKRYHIPMIVTENGVADSIDRLRPRYLVSHIKSVEKALSMGMDIRGYLHWSLIDNYEWASGFSMKFGLYGIDLNNKKIQHRPSALVFKEIANANGVPEEFEWMADQHQNS
ncbi:beta-galactosidase [Picrophilus oshimae DSM 9789]|uniref:Beta-galactosidase n=2 Tax=Picrophilus oshimae TaxID=46632 RepID=Q6KZ14_PICTO|nr:beta-galactosidase BgaS [Picrophilus oshimae]AAT44038.1 beta-galactosidase [Picrophilus oshimae DSM 9789]